MLLNGTACDRLGRISGRSGVPTESTKAPVDVDSLVTEMGDGGMDRFMAERGRVAIIEFHAEWSGRSQQLKPFFRETAARHDGKVVVGRVDFDCHKKLAETMGVKELPDIRIYRDGKFVERIVGMKDERELKSRIGKYCEGLEAPVIAAYPGGRPVAKPMSKDWMPQGMRRR